MRHGPAPHHVPQMSFIGTIQGLGPLGYLAYAAVYMGLEVLAVPAVPFTMAAGALFGPVRGTAVASLAGTVAACIGERRRAPHVLNLDVVARSQAHVTGAACVGTG